MPNIPDSETLQRTIATLEGQIFMEWGRINKVLEANPNATRQMLLSEFTHVYNLLTRRHTLELQRTYPGVQVMYEVEFLGVRDADGEWLDRPARKGRIADSALKGDFLQLVEVKTRGEILRAVPKGSRLLVQNFLASSTLGQQISVEKYLLKWGSRRGVAFWFSAHNPVTLNRLADFEMQVGDVKISRVQDYKNMGDGIDASRLFRSPPPGKGGGATSASRGAATPDQGTATPKPAQTSGPAVADRALANNGTGDRGTKPVNQEIRVVKTPNPRLGTMPAPSGPTPRFDQLVKPNPAQALQGNVARQGGVAGAWGMIYSGQLSYMSKAAKGNAESAVRDQMGEIDHWRANGEYVLVQVKFADPESRDVFGMATDSYSIYMGIEIYHSPPVLNHHGEEVSMEKLMAELKRSSYGMSEKSFEGEGRGKLPGRKAVNLDYALYQPFPTPIGTVFSDEPPQFTGIPGVDAINSLNWRMNWNRRQADKPNVKNFRGVEDRCTK